MTHNNIIIDSKLLKKLCARQPAVLKLFFYLLIHVGSKPSRIADVALAEGQLLVSRRTLASRLGVNEGEIRLLLDQLILLDLIEVSPRKRYTVITICNYSAYGQDVPEKKKAKAQPLESTLLSHPTLDEITEYCRQRGSTVDAAYFFDYYQSVGWKVGRNTMKDWRAAIRTWEKRAKPANVAVKHTQQKKYERF